MGQAPLHLEPAGLRTGGAWWGRGRAVLESPCSFKEKRQRLYLKEKNKGLLGSI